MTFKHLDATAALKQHVKEKTKKLEKYTAKSFQIHWVFYLEGTSHVADLRVQGPQINYFAESKTTDLYQSIDEAVGKIEKQLKKHKEIQKNKRVKPIKTKDIES